MTNIDILHVEDAEGVAEKGPTKAQEIAALLENFLIVRRLQKDRRNILEHINQDARSGNEEAIVARLIANTGFSIGGGFTEGKPTYATVTLLPKHVKVNGDELSFNFIGKSGVRQRHSVEGKELSMDVKSRMNREKLFNTTDRAVRRYFQSLAVDGRYKVLHFRMWVATVIAYDLTRFLPKPESIPEYILACELVGNAVSTRIGCTFTESLERYVDPLILRRPKSPQFDHVRDSFAVALNIAYQKNRKPIPISELDELMHDFCSKNPVRTGIARIDASMRVHPL